MKRKYQLACGIALGGAVLAPRPAHAILCDDVNLPNKVYGVGGSAVTATLRKIAQKIADDPNAVAAEQTTIFWAQPNACVGFGDYVTGKTSQQFLYWIKGGTADQKCDARAGGQPVDFSHMGNDAGLCTAVTVPDDVGDFPAPIQTVNLITGLASSETSISAEAIHFIYGYGPNAGQVSPWSEGAGVFTRQSTAFVTLLLGAHANLPATAFIGPSKWAQSNTATDPGAAVQDNGAVVTAVKNYSTDEAKASAALGYVSGSTADGRRSDAKTLAFQAFDQTCGVFPDSTPTALDKINVRRGKYALWAQGHYFTKVDSTGKPENALVENLIGWFSGKTLPPGTTVSAFDQTIAAGDIPECAMDALREGTTGPFYSFQSPKPCHGRFEKVATGSTEHAICVDDGDCEGETPACNFGYCEAYRAEGEEEG